MRRLILYIVLILANIINPQLCLCQLSVYTETYTTSNGLAQNDINDMVKDHNGFLWVATDNGISRFDGYSFISHKISTSQFNCSLNNQFENIVVDSNNNIIARNSMGQVILFNQRTHDISIFPDPKQNRGDKYIYIKKIIDGGQSGVWLLGEDKGLINIREKDGNILPDYYCFDNKTIGSKAKCIYQEKDGTIWLLTDRGVGIIDVKSHKISNVYFYKENISFNDCSELENKIIFACNSGLVIQYDKLKKRFSKTHIGVQENILKLHIIDQKTAILTTENEIVVYDTQLNTCLKKSNAEDICESWMDNHKNIWLFNNRVLYKYNTKDYSLIKTNLNLPASYVKNLTDKSSFPIGYLSDDQEDLFTSLSDKADLSNSNSKYLCKILEDKTGVYWTNSYFGGLRKCVTASSTFNFIKLSGKSDCSVCALIEDNQKRLWVATTDDKIRVFDENYHLIGFLSKSGSIVGNDCLFDNVTCLYQDRDNNIWIGAHENLFKLTLNKSNSRNYAISQFHIDRNAPIGTAITDILEDHNGHLWLTTDGDGLQLLQVTNGQYHFANRRSELQNSYPPTLLKTNCLYEDNKGCIWLGSSEGLALFSSDFPSLRFLKFFYYNPENSNMTTSVITGLFQNKKGDMWLSSYGGGILKISKSFVLGDSPEFIAYNKDNKKLGTDLTLSLEEGQDGVLWVATEKSLIKLEEKTENKDCISFANEIGHNSFGRQIFIKTSNNSFVLGAESGLYIIKPQDLKKDNFSPSIVFTRFQLFNKDVDVNAEGSPLESDINTSKEITLSHKQNVFSIEYAALDFRNSANIEYAYKLDNFEEEWNYVGSQRNATYTNLPPGDYTFRVKSTNSAGNWCNNDKVILIHIQPSFWQTGWAWCLYILIFGLVLGGVIYAYLAFYKMRSKMKFEQDMSTMKMQFFTDISHELRTPLTLINAPLENVLDNGNINSEDRKQLEVVHTNSQRMLRMLTQILDFRKLQSNKMRLRVEKTNIYELVSKCCGNFSKMAENRQINFTVENKLSNPFYWIDKDKMDTVMFNLLSNAFKFTPEKKSITVELVSNEDDSCSIKVIDEGCGMPKDKLGIIFDRFSTLQEKSLTNQSGTGIGLALVKEIADLHKAKIEVNSIEGEGSTFAITLLPGTAHYDELSADIIINDKECPKKDEIATSKEENDGKLKLLIIEDNNELREFIVSVLSKTFHVIEASNGKDGLDITTSEMPDFVISDIMMPVMDGIEYVKQVRSNSQTSHIPVVLLTAKTDMQSKIECLKLGANDYITKPFSMVYLQARIDNILAERKSLQEKYRNQLQSIDPIDSVNSQQKESETIEEIDKRDDEFMKKMVDYINAHIDDSNLSPEELANGLKVSRWNLTCKVKSLIGQPPVEFIKDIRLNKAAQLIKDGELSMTQISYMIGMTDSRYFSRCFKQKFGMTPTEYRNAQK